MQAWKSILIGILLLWQTKSLAQAILFDEHFHSLNKNEFIGDTGNFQINTLQQLQLAGFNHPDTANLWHQHIDSTWQEQQLWVQLKFSPSASNQFRWYLASNSLNQADTSFKAYFIEVGENGNNDTWRFMKQEGQSISQLASGTLGLLAKNENTFRLRIRYQGPNWQISIDSLGSRQFEFRTDIRDSISFACSATGIRMVYTSTRAKLFFVDDWYIGDSIVDYQAPYVSALSYSLPKEIIVHYSEAVRKESLKKENFLLDGNPMDSVFRDANEFDKVHLITSSKLSEGLHYLFSSNVSDEAGNTMTGINSPLDITQCTYHEILISEFLADPTPSIGLPNCEFVELYNPTKDSFNLHDFYFGDSSRLTRFQKEHWIHKNEYLIVCATSNCKLFSNQHCIETDDFPSLNNSGDKLVLLNQDSTPVDVITYDLSYYADAFKSNGGFSIERLDLNHPCDNPSNWQASISPKGGTPGERNSILKTISPHEAFECVHGELINSNRISITLNESLRADQISHASCYLEETEDTLKETIYNYNQSYQLQFISPVALDTHSIYTIHLQGIENCFGQAINSNKSIAIGYGFEADSGEICINEILFNPKPEDDDYIELYNTSTRSLDLSKLKIAKLLNGSAEQFYALINTPRNILPQEILCLSKDPNKICLSYPSNQSKQVIAYHTICSMNDDTDRIILINRHGLRVEEIAYHENWQHPLLNDVEGVALERRSSSQSGLTKDNWVSACANDGYGTPGLMNAASADIPFSDSSEDWLLYPKLLTPNGDGIDDYLYLQKKMDGNTSIAEIKIVSTDGELVTKVCDPQSISAQEEQIWNGILGDGKKAPFGIYYVWIRYGTLNTKSKTTLLPFYVNAEALHQ